MENIGSTGLFGNWIVGKRDFGMNLMRTIVVVFLLSLASLGHADAQCGCVSANLYEFDAGWLVSNGAGGSPLYNKLKVTIDEKPLSNWDPQGSVRIRHIYWQDVNNPSVNGTFVPTVFGVTVVNLPVPTSGTVVFNVIYEDENGTEIDINCTTLVSCEENFSVSTASSSPPDPVIYPIPMSPIPGDAGVVGGATAFYPPSEMISHGVRQDSDWMTPTISRVLFPNNQHAIGNLSPGHFFTFDFRITVYPDPVGTDAMILFDPVTGQSVYFEDGSVNGTANDGAYEPENNVYFREAYLTNASNAPSNSPENAGASQLFLTLKRRNGVVYKFELVDAPRFNEEPVTPVGRLVSMTELNGFATTFTYKSFSPTQIAESPRRQLQINTITDGFGAVANVTYETNQQSGRWVVDGIAVNRVAGSLNLDPSPVLDSLDYNYTDGKIAEVKKNGAVKSIYDYGFDTSWQAATIEWTEEDWLDDRNGTLFLSADYMSWGQHLVNQFAACVVGRGAGRDSDNDGDYDEVIRYLTVLRDPTEGSRFRLIYHQKVLQWHAGRYLRFFTNPNPDPNVNGYAKYNQGTLEATYAQHPGISDAQVLTATPPTIVDETGYTVTQTYDAARNPTTTTFPDATTEVRVFDTENRLVYSKARNGSVREFEYTSGSLTRIKNGMAGSYGNTSVSSATSSNQIVMTYNGFGQTATVATTPVGAPSPTANQRYDLSYDDVGRLIQVQFPFAEGQTARSSITTTWNYGQPATQTDVNGDPRTFTYDAIGRLVKTVFSDGTTEQAKFVPGFAYFKDRGGVVSRTYRDEVNRVLSVTSPYVSAIDLDTADLNVGFDHADRSISIFTYLSGSMLPIFQDHDGARTTLGYDYRNRTTDVIAQPRDSFFRKVTINYVNNLPFKQEQLFYGHNLRKFYAFESETAGNPRRFRTVRAASTGTTFADSAAVLAASLTAGSNPAYTVEESKYYPSSSKLERVYPNGARLVEEFNALGNRVSEKIFESIAASNPSFATSNLFDTQGRVTQSTDVNGLVTVLAYDDASKLKTVTAPGSKVYNIKYLADGRISSVEMPESTGGTPVIVKPNFAGIGNGSQANASNQGMIVNRDALGRIVHVASVSNVTSSTSNKLNPTDPDTIREITYRYAPNGKLAYKTIWNNPLTADINVAIPRIAGLDSVASTDGITTQYLYDSAMFDNIGLSGPTGQSVLRPGSTTPVNISIYNARQKLASVTSQGGASTAFTWQHSGTAESKIAPDGNTMTVRIHDGLGRLVMDALMKKPLSGSLWELVSWECYWCDRVESSTDSGLTETTIVVDSTGKTRKLRVNGLGVPVNLINENSKVMKLESNELGDLTKIIDRLGNSSTNVFDNFGRLTQSISPVGQAVSMAYGTTGTSTGMLTTITDSKGKTGTYTYDSLGQNQNFNDRKNKLSWNYFDALTGLQNKFRDSQGRETLYGYDINRRMNQLTFSDGSVMTFDHDPLGRLKELKNPSDKRQLPTYNFNGTLDKVDYKISAGTSVSYTEDFYQDAFGRTWKAETKVNSNPVVTNSVTSFDNFGKAAAATTTYNGQSYNVSIDRNSLGQVQSITYPSGRIASYTYTATGQIASITWNGTLIETRTYDNADRLTNVNRLGSINESRTYDAAGRLTNISNDKSGTTLLAASYTYDANNNLTGEALSGYGGGANHSYSTVQSGQSNPDGYDENDDRIRWNQSARTIAMVRSNIGNIITYTENGTSSGRTYNAAHALTQFFGNTQVYNTDGNLTTAADGTTLVWDVANRLTQVTYPNSGGMDQYGYDALGRRAWKSHTPTGQSTTTTVYVYFGNNCIAEYSSGGTVINEYVYAGGIDSLVMVSRSNDTQRYGVLRSARWNVLALHDLVTHTNGIVELYSYDIFGARSIWAANGTTSRAVSSYGMEIGNTSCRHDKKFIYMRNRYYDPISGEFISRDPKGFVDGSSLYRGYFQSSAVDPMGLGLVVTTADGNTVSADEYIAKQGDLNPEKLNIELIEELTRQHNPDTLATLMVTLPAVDYEKFQDRFGAPESEVAAGDGWTRCWGVAKVAGGAVEVIAGVTIGSGTAVTGVGLVGGGLMAAHGVDTFQAGVRQAWYGEEVRTATSHTIEAGASVVVEDKETAKLVGEVGDAIIGLGSGGGVTKIAPKLGDAFGDVVVLSTKTRTALAGGGHLEEVRDVSVALSPLVEGAVGAAGVGDMVLHSRRLDDAIGGGAAAAPNSADDLLVRRGTSRESAQRLAKQAEAAEKAGTAQNGVPYGHGVSVTTPESNLRLAKDPLDAVTAERKALEEAGFEVRPTPTRADPNHHTVQLPKPVTEQVADLFNQIFGRKPKGGS